MDDAKTPKLYPICPYRNVEAAFARFYEAAPEPRLTPTEDGRAPLHIDDFRDWVHRQVLKRRAVRMDARMEARMETRERHVDPTATALLLARMLFRTVAVHLRGAILHAQEIRREMKTAAGEAASGVATGLAPGK